MKRTCLFLAALWVSVFTAEPGAQNAKPEPQMLEAAEDGDALARRAEEKIRAAKTIAFRARQRYSLEGLSVRVEEGDVAFRRPNRIRWAYLGPEKKLFVSNGKQTFFHLPSERVVYTAPLKEALRASPLLSFLVRDRSLVSAYDFETLERGEDGSWQLRARPRKREEALIPFLVSLSPGHDLLKVAYLDGADGLMEIFLSDMQYDVPLDEALFGFEAPADAEVMEGMRFGIEEP